jgi:MoaE-MoaD fusion protein
VHRLGRMDIGDTSVAIVVAAPHRKPAFAAALEGINRLKKLVPIWKKEHFEDGEVWVEGEWDESVLGARQ